MLSQGIAERVPAPYLAMNPEDASRLRIEEGEKVELSISGATCIVPVKKRTSLPRGIAGLPVGLPGIEKFALPEWGRVGKIHDEGEYLEADHGVWDPHRHAQYCRAPYMA